MMAMQMMIGEVHIEELYSVKSAKKFVILSRFMHEFMCHYKLSCIVIACDEGKSNYEGKGLHCDFHC